MSVLSSIASYVAPLSHSAREHRRENFPAMTHAEANDAQVETLLEQAPREDLIVEIQRLRAENAQLRMAAELNRNTIIGMCRND